MASSPADFAHHIGVIIGRAFLNALTAQPAPTTAASPSSHRRSRAAVRQPARKLHIGQRVEYRQGRGTFLAKVVRLDPKRGTTVLERVKDKKRISRPISKVYPAA